MGVLGEIERMVGSRERRFQISQEGIDGAKLLQPPAVRTAAGDRGLVRENRFCDGPEEPQSIGNDIGRILLIPIADLLFVGMRLLCTHPKLTL